MKTYRNMEYAELLVSFAKLLAPKVYVELGIKAGYTIHRLGPFVEKAIGIDIHPKYASHDNITIIQSTTQDYAKTLEAYNYGEFIDMLFIDADHSREAVLEDVLAYLPYVRSGTGMIFLHDTHPVVPELITPGYCDTAWMAAAQLHQRCHTHRIEIVTIPKPYAGLSILRKLGPHHLSWKTA